MNFIKSHLKEFILLIIAVLIILFCGISFAVMWFSGGSNDVYGDRLADIEDVKLSDLNEITNSIKSEKEYVNNISYNIEGKLISFIVKVNEGTDVDSTKTIGDSLISKLTEEELAFYDIQLYILDSLDNEESRFPIIGYKHKKSEVFQWSNN